MSDRTDTSGKYKVYLGGRERGLRYTVKEREALEALYPRPDGTPNDLMGLVQTHLVSPGAFSVQAALLWAGLHCVDSRIRQDKVKEWLSKHVEEGQQMKAIFIPVFNAIMESGVLGAVLKDAITGEEDEDDEEGPKEKKPTPKS